MASAENTEVLSDKEEGDEMASLHLLDKKGCEEPIDKIEGSSNLNIVNKSTADDASVSDESTGKNMEKILLDSLAQEEREMDKLTDSDNQDEEMQLRWDDDDLDEEEVANENDLLGEGSLDAPLLPLTLKDEVIKSIEDEEKLLESEADDSKESPPQSTLDNVFVPKIGHNLNKPDMMLEIPSHELIEFSDDEDLTTNLEMSPDMETDDEVSANNVSTKEVQTDVHKEEIDKEVRMVVDENALENEAKIAADILTKLNNMDDDESIITDDLCEINKEINEDELLKDDEQDVLLEYDEQDELLQDQTDVTEEPFEIIYESMEDVEKPEVESQEDKVQGQITGSCEEMYLNTGENESQELESKNLKSESAVDIFSKMTEIESKDDSRSKIENNESDTVSEPTADILVSTVDQSTSVESVTIDNIHTTIVDKASIETEREEEKLQSNEQINELSIDSVINESESDSQLSTSNEPEILQKEVEAENITDEFIITAVEKTLQSSEQIKSQNDPTIDQLMTESFETPEKSPQKNDSNIKDPSPRSDRASDREITPELRMSPDESINDINTELLAQTVDEPKPDVPTCETELRMSSDESLNETGIEMAKIIDEQKSPPSASETELRMSSDESFNEASVELPAQTIDETKLNISPCEAELRMSSDESISETVVELSQTIDEPKPLTSMYETELSSDKSLDEITVDLPAQAIDEPKPSSSACETKPAMTSDEPLNETTVELPAQTIDEPKPSTSACETKLIMTSDETLNEVMVELPAQTINEPKPSTSTCETKLVKTSDEPLSETTVLLLDQRIDEPKPSTSTSETKLTMPSDETLNEVMVELPAQTINEPKPSTPTCETKLVKTSDEPLSETTVLLLDQRIDEPKPSTSTSETKLTMPSNEPLNETTIELPAQTVYEPKPSTSTSEIILTMPSDEPLNETMVELPDQRIDEPKPSTSTCVTKLAMSSGKPLNETKIELPAQTIDEPKPSTSAVETKVSEASMFGSMMVQETSKDVPEMTDSLGLLAESSRVIEEDEEQEYDEEGEDEDDSDRDHDDESSNQMTAEHSEDSNAQHSETDQLKEENNDKEFTFTITDVASEVNKDEAMECDVGESDAPVDTVPVDKAQETENDKEEPPGDNAKDNKDAEAMEIETVKLSDTSDNEVETETGELTILKQLLSQDGPSKNETEEQSPSKTSKLEIVKQNNVMSFVDLEETSSEDDVQETKKETQTEKEDEIVKEPADVVKAVEDKQVEFEPERVLQSSPLKTVTPLKDMNTASDGDANETMPKTTMGLEIFNLDSDEDEPATEEKTENIGQPLNSDWLKCINQLCVSDTGVEYYIADSVAINFYDADKKKRGYVCKNCFDAVEQRNQELVSGIKNFTPLLELSMNRSGEELVEISDSESEDEPELDQDQIQLIGVEGAKVAESVLEQMINETWIKYKMDDRLAETQNTLQKELERLQKESAELNEMFNECQSVTDQLRNELYATFEPDIRKLPPIVIYDMPNCRYSCVEPSSEVSEQGPRKRTLSPSTEMPAKRPAIPLGYAPLDDKANDDSMKIRVTSEKAEDDNTDVAVVKLSAESAPKDLPPTGEITMTPIKVGMAVYAMKNAFGSWMKAKVVEIVPKPPNSAFTLCRVKFDHVVSKNPFKVLPARCIAYCEPPDVRMTIGRRVIALFKDTSSREAYYSGIIAEIPNPVNSYRYLIFFDDGYAQYAHHSQTRLVCECSSFVWEEVHPYSREFVRQYLLAYPERPMVRLHAGQNLKTEWRGKWWPSRVVRVDASMVEVQIVRRDRREWIYRGSTRLAPLYLELQAAERARPRAMPRAQLQGRPNMPYVEYTRSDEQNNKSAENQQTQQQQRVQQQQQQQQQNEEMRRQRAVAKKSTTAPPPPAPSAENLDNVTSRVVYYTPKNAVKPYKMVPHNCSPKCKRSDVLALKDLRTYNPLAKPLLSGWERQIVRWKGQRVVLYVAPCGRRLRDVQELHKYLQMVKSDMPVDLFDFSPATHCLAEFVLNKCFVGKKDLSHGKENVPVPCVNYYDESLPEFCSYNTERTPTAGVPLNLDPDFLCGCDCEDDCEDKTKCACWKMTLEGAKTIGLEGDNVGYVYKRLPEPLPSGIYECNSRCKCKHTCLNRVAQHPLQLKLQVFKTLNRGWGIRALNDVPKGAFLCVYAGNLLTDATANLDGLNEGDEYLAELDYIEVVEQMKEGYEEDIPEDIKKLDKKDKKKSEDAEEEEEDEEEQSSEEETGNNKTDLEDDDFQPGCIGLGVAEFSKRLRKRDSKKKGKKEGADKNEKEKEDKKEGDKEGNQEEDCITISDDEELREPSCFTAAAGMGANEFISKYRSVRTLFGEDEACYIMDAKVQGNIGRYLNHSCSPNVFVQNVFVDTHDPRFPWVAFFALSHIRAGTELTWNYNYDVGSVPGKVLYCHCGATNCRGRLL